MASKRRNSKTSAPSVTLAGESRPSDAQLAAEIAGLEQLQRISTQLIQENNIDALYQQILDAAVTIMNADMSSLQMLFPARNELLLLAWRGFDPASAAHWEWVKPESGSACAEVLRTRQMVIVPDVDAADFIVGTSDHEFFHRSGIRAVQSTPLIARSGQIVGVLSTHWCKVHQPAEREQRLLDVLARQAADLIERKRSEDAARLERQQLYELFMQSPGIIAILKGEDLRFELVNPPVLRLWHQKSADDLLDKPLVEALPELRGSDFETLLKQVYTTGQPFYGNEFPALSDHNGDDLYFNFVSIPMRDADGEVEGVMAFGYEVTDQVIARRKIQESETKYRTLFNSIDEAFALCEIITDRGGKATDYRFLEVNPAFEKMMGITPQAARGSTARELIPDLDDWWLETCGRIALRGEVTRFENRLAGMDRWFDVYAAPIGERGNGRFTLVFSDITERKMADQALHDSQQETMRARDYAEATLRTSPVPLLVLEQDLRVKTVNEAFLRTFHVTAAETEGRLIYELGGGQWNHPRLRRLLEEVLPHESLFENFEITQEFEGLGSRTMLLNARRMENQAGLPERIVLVIDDVTEHREAERLRAQQQRELAVLEERHRIARDLHDSVSQALFAASMVAETLTSLWNSRSDRALDQLGMVRSLVQGAGAEMRTLLWELRPEAIIQVPLSELLKQLALAIQARKKATVSLVMHGREDDPLPPDVQMAFYRIAQESINNILKHSEASNIHIRVRCTPAYIALTVRDDGRGFDISKASTGLGLSNMQERATSIGARFDMKSRVGQGTRIRLLWPCAK